MSENKTGLNFWDFTFALLVALDIPGILLFIVVACSVGGYMVDVWQDEQRQDRISACISVGHTPAQCSKLYQSPK